MIQWLKDTIEEDISRHAIVFFVFVCLCTFVVLIYYFIWNSGDDHKTELQSEIPDLMQNDSINYKGFFGSGENITFYVLTENNKFVEVNESVWNQLTWVIVK
jgi:hypothetical protein